MQDNQEALAYCQKTSDHPVGMAHPLEVSGVLKIKEKPPALETVTVGNTWDLQSDAVRSTKILTLPCRVSLWLFYRQLFISNKLVILLF